MLKKKYPQLQTNKVFIGCVIIALIIAVFFNQIVASLQFLYGITFSKNIELKKENGNINMLLLGIGGGKHEGKNLTDTIIFANINPKTKTVNLISIPRDLWIPELKGKINKAYSDGQDKGGRGILLAKAAVGKVVGENIDYVLVLDFQGFTTLVDYLGGVEVNVLNALDDYSYPIGGKEEDSCGKSEDEIKEFSSTVSAEMEFWNFFPCRYKYLHVDKGIVHMNGETSLAFVRSRHATGSEGTDFARSQRQQQVISSIREKVLSLGIILNPIKLIGIYNIISSNINMDIKSSEFDDFVKLAQQLKGAKINNSVLDEGDGVQGRSGLLMHPGISEDQNFEWTLIPRKGDGDFSEIQEYIKCINHDESCTVGEVGITQGKKL